MTDETKYPACRDGKGNTIGWRDDKGNVRFDCGCTINGTEAKRCTLHEDDDGMLEFLWYTWHRSGADKYLYHPELVRKP